MDNNYKIARPYASAVFNLALELKTLDLWSEVFETLLVVSQNEDFILIANNTSVSNELVLNLLLDIIKKPSSYIKEFLFLLIKNHRIFILKEICILFAEKFKQHNNLLNGTIVSAFEINAKDREKIETLLSKKFNKLVTLDVEIDSKLIGGIKIIINDKIIDYSIHGSLNLLATSIID